MTTWQAMVQHDDHPQKLSARCNELGAEGWELVCVTTEARAAAPVLYVAWLKRPVQPPKRPWEAGYEGTR